MFRKSYYKLTMTSVNVPLKLNLCNCSFTHERQLLGSMQSSKNFIGKYMDQSMKFRERLVIDALQLN